MIIFIGSLFVINSVALALWICLTERQIQKWEREK
ncbi:hypothetical protein DFO69_1424 [Bacillus subtilis]|nr:hypothetical protein DFO69_1424 [Bacillus subtilis]